MDLENCTITNGPEYTNRKRPDQYKQEPKIFFRCAQNLCVPHCLQICRFIILFLYVRQQFTIYKKTWHALSNNLRDDMLESIGIK
jgi:hypothetical protein